MRSLLSFALWPLLLHVPAEAQRTHRVAIAPSLAPAYFQMAPALRAGACVKECGGPSQLWVAVEGSAGFLSGTVSLVSLTPQFSVTRYTDDWSVAASVIRQRSLAQLDGWQLSLQLGASAGVLRRDRYERNSLDPVPKANFERAVEPLLGGTIGMGISRPVFGLGVGALVRMDVLTSGVRFPIGLHVSF
ncbi:MAG: hypothetical protein NW201_09710 [Gemmatimonadales bacterium]|nr:hypothetical protein [Gemmatimonadales bacterium]